MQTHLKIFRKVQRSAERAIEVYESGDYNFNLVGVAQGNSIKEYLAEGRRVIQRRSVNPFTGSCPAAGKNVISMGPRGFEPPTFAV